MKELVAFTAKNREKTLWLLPPYIGILTMVDIEPLGGVAHLAFVAGVYQGLFTEFFPARGLEIRLV